MSAITAPLAESLYGCAAEWRKRDETDPIGVAAFGDGAGEAKSFVFLSMGTVWKLLGEKNVNASILKYPKI